ncbi:MAG: RNA polymerase sigma factor [Gaiellaceae bacterium]|jgi:RNA polymerase sigma factor (sigma-70 family)
MERSDAELIRAARTDASAFGELYERHAAAVFRWCERRAHHVAADLAGETFAQAWLSRHRFRDRRDGSALPWLLGIAQNVLNESRRRDRVETRARARLGLPLDLADDEYERVEERLSVSGSLAVAVGALPAHEREALELRVRDDLSYEDVARRLEIRPAAARLRVSRALKRLSPFDPKEEM